MKKGSKYSPLFNHLRGGGHEKVELTFVEIEALLGVDLPLSARTTRGWWSNRSTGSVQAVAWMGAGYHVENLDLEKERVTFRKPLKIYEVKRKGDTVLWNGDLVRALRVHSGWTQAELAEELGVRQQTISEWETGVYEPRLSNSKHLARIAEEAGFKYGEDQ